MIAQTPQPPYYAVIFSSLRTQENNGYAAMAKQMEELAQQQPGYLYMKVQENNWALQLVIGKALKP
jgi:heme-degrading monooxygenase HmoA